MVSLTAAGEVLVVIVSATAQLNPPAWNLEYDVRNTGKIQIWLVVEESLRLQQDETHIELSYARGKMRPGTKVFGYFIPKVAGLLPGESLRQSIKVSWPCRLSDIWNAEREVALPIGEYDVSVRVGFGRTAEPESPKVAEEIEASVLRWQKEAVSQSVRIRIPPHALSE